MSTSPVARTSQPDAPRAAPWLGIPRSYGVAIIVTALLAHSFAAEGFGGIVAIGYVFVIIPLMWWLAKRTTLDQLPFFKTLCNVLFQFTPKGSAKVLPKKRRVVFSGDLNTEAEK